MRKKIVTIAGVLLVLAVLCAVEQSVVNTITREALFQIQEILEMVRRGELRAGLEKAHALDVFWDGQASGLEILVDHSDAEKVNSGISRLIAALEGDDQAMAMIYVHEVKKNIEHVRERQALTIQNVL